MIIQYATWRSENDIFFFYIRLDHFTFANFANFVIFIIFIIFTMSDIQDSIISNFSHSLQTMDKTGAEFYKKILLNDFENFYQNLSFYSLPLNIILSIIEDIDFSDFDDPLLVIKTLVQNIDLHFPNDSALILHSIHANDFLDQCKECVEMLGLFSSCDIFQKLSELYTDESSFPRLDFEYEIQQKEKQILELKAKLNEQDIIPSYTFDPIIEKPSDFEPDIHKAAYEGKLESVQYLIEKQGVNKDLPNKDKESPLFKACRGGHLKIVEYLIEKQGANKEFLNNYGNTPLYNACSVGWLLIVRYLIEKQKVNPFPSNLKKCTPI